MKKKIFQLDYIFNQIILRNVLNHMDLLAKEVNCLDIRHILREANDVADSLAKKGVQRRRPRLYLQQSFVMPL